jgi:hypothetical protein
MLVILVENGFSSITSSLLQTGLILCLRATKRLSANLQIYTECEVSKENVFIVGQVIKDYQY